MQYTLGDHTLDMQRYELRRAGTALKLQPKIVDLLACLIQHRDRWSLGRNYSRPYGLSNL
jgi:DNA-binding response OmpR family regulator